ncbi:hypothetical protein KAJ38_01085 [Candidatus Pacearchaeota archaeon]|nr:hypothetical protein [Candidatus Pacearchaeota archaeon]
MIKNVLKHVIGKGYVDRLDKKNDRDLKRMATSFCESIKETYPNARVAELIWSIDPTRSGEYCVLDKQGYAVVVNGKGEVYMENNDLPREPPLSQKFLSRYGCRPPVLKPKKCLVEYLTGKVRVHGSFSLDKVAQRLPEDLSKNIEIESI